MKDNERNVTLCQTTLPQSRTQKSITTPFPPLIVLAYFLDGYDTLWPNGHGIFITVCTYTYNLYCSSSLFLNDIWMYRVITFLI